MSGEAHKEVDRLLAGLEHLDETVRIESLQKLVSAPGAPLLRVLRKTARFDASPTVRAEAVRLLAEVAERLSGTDLSGSGTGADDSTRRLVLLNDPDSKVRAQAVAALTMSFDARVPEILLTALEREKDPGVLETLIQAVASEGASVAPKLIGFLAHEDARVRAAAVEVLGDTKDDSALTHLVPLLEDKHERVRVAAVRALRSARQEAVLACVDEMLKRTGERDVRAALYVLRYFASAISVPRLAPRLTGTPPSVAAMARASIASLAKKGSKRAKRALERVGMTSGLETPSGTYTTKKLDPAAQAAADKRLESVLEIVKAGDKEKLKTLRGRLDREDDPRVLAAMVMAIGRLGGPGDLPLMAPFLGHKRSRVRTAAVKSVAQLDPRAVSMLLPALRDRSSRVRAQGILCLAGAKGINVMGSLRQMAASKDPRVVLTAVWTAAKIKNDGARELLEALAESTDADVRAEAVRALGRGAPPPVQKDDSVDLARKNGDESVLMSVVEARAAHDDTVTVNLDVAGEDSEAEVAAPAFAPAPMSRMPDINAALAPDESMLPGAGLNIGGFSDNETFVGEPISAEPSGAEEEDAGPPASRAGTLGTPQTPGTVTQALGQAQSGKGVRRSESVGGPTMRPSQRTRAGTGAGAGEVGRDAAKRKLPMPAIAGAAAALAVVVLFALMPASAPTVTAPAPTRVASSAPPPAPTVVASASPSEKPPEVNIVFAPAAMQPAGLTEPPEPTIEAVEESIKLMHAKRGITSRPIIHLMALDFVQAGYRTEIGRARQAAADGATDAALAILEAALAKLPSDHLTGRVAVLRAMVTIAREGEKFEKLKAYRKELMAEQQKLIELATEAARDGGLRDHELKNLLARIKEAEKQKAEATRSADWLSGAKMFDEQPGKDAGG